MKHCKFLVDYLSVVKNCFRFLASGLLIICVMIASIPLQSVADLNGEFHRSNLMYSLKNLYEFVKPVIELRYRPRAKPEIKVCFLVADLYS